jgi:hypothetical protein
VVLATITEEGRAVVTEATDALNQADFGLTGLTRQQAIAATATLRLLRTTAGDV